MMSVQLPDGVVFAMATPLAAPNAVTKIANGPNPILTAPEAALKEGDIVVLHGGWHKLNDRPIKLGAKSTLRGLDTTDTTQYPPESSGGRVQKVLDWQPLQQILTAETSGGDQNFITYAFLENDFESQIPSRQAPVVITLSIADDDTLPGYRAIKSAAESQAVRVLRATLPGGTELYYNGYVSLNETPSMTKDQVMAVTATFSLIARPMRYGKQ